MIVSLKLRDFLKIKPRLRAKIRYVLIGKFDGVFPKELMIYVGKRMGIDQLTMVGNPRGVDSWDRSWARQPRRLFIKKATCSALAKINRIKLKIEDQDNRDFSAPIRKWLERDLRDEYLRNVQRLQRRQSLRSYQKIRNMWLVVACFWPVFCATCWRKPIRRA